MEWSTLISYIQKGESTSLCFISHAEIEDDIGPYVVAMANQQGGTLIVGMDINDMHLIGTSLNKDWVDDICKTFCRPNLTVQTDIIQKNDKNILCIIVPAGSSKPYFYKRTSYQLHESHGCIVLQKNDADNYMEYVQKEPTHKPALSVSSELKPKLEPEIEEKISSIALLSDLSEKKETPPNMNHYALTNASQNNEKPNDLNPRQTKALAYVRAHASIKNKEYRNLFDVSHKTAHLELVDMVAKHYIIVKGSGRSTAYVLNPNKELQSLLI